MSLFCSLSYKSTSRPPASYFQKITLRTYSRNFILYYQTSVYVIRPPGLVGWATKEVLHHLLLCLCVLLKHFNLALSVVHLSLVALVTFYFTFMTKEFWIMSTDCQKGRKPNKEEKLEWCLSQKWFGKAGYAREIQQG